LATLRGADFAKFRDEQWKREAVRRHHHSLGRRWQVTRLRDVPSFGPDRVIHYNSYPAADISGGAITGVGSGQAVLRARQETDDAFKVNGTPDSTLGLRLLAAS